jgi:putative PEP-CTERM system histidine kinase
MHLSRKVVFESTALVVSGAFLLAIAAAGYLLRYLGGDWGRALQIELVFAALFAMVLVAYSGSFRSKLKVFVSKHFFSYRYDYREEWLRFTRTLSGEGGVQAVQERTVAALANLVESPAGMLWLETAERGYRPTARWNMAEVSVTEPSQGSLASFLRRTGWIVNVPDYPSKPEQYAGLSLPSWLDSIPQAWLIVPLMTASELLGFVVLATPRARIEVDWEVRDLLKTASQQAASYLGQVRATDALLEARKFEAFNRMSAFVVHDLKNLVAQLALLLKNAERHRNNPEFQRDMMETVAHAIERMNGLMLQLRTGARPVEGPRPVDLGLVIQRACKAKGVPDASIELNLATGVVALGDEDRLEHVVGHLLQNAIDATAASGRVSISLHHDDRFAVVEVADSGVGMSEEFIRERLFKPFETTKNLGMGIGVYESSQYVAQLGGQLLVDSTPSVGTRVRVLLPSGDSKATPSAPLKEVA